MKIQIINSGNEILTGSVVNTDLSIISRRLAGLGLKVDRAYTIKDSPAQYIETLHLALQEADWVIVTGGLGSTTDDLTMEMTAQFFSRELHMEDAVRRKLHAVWCRRHPGGGSAPKAFYRQALVPDGASYFDNPSGTAPAIEMSVSYNNAPRMVWLLPGPPFEICSILDASLTERWRQLASEETHIFTHGILAAGESEPSVQQKVQELLSVFPSPPEIAYCAVNYGTRVFATGEDEDILLDFLEKLRNSIGRSALPIDEVDLAAAVLRMASEQKRHIVTAESCTGGMLSSMLCDIPGASQSFSGSAVCYSNELKTKLLGVERKLLAEYGAVSAECAKAMASGASKYAARTLAVAITGIAGPDGGSEAKPAGTVFIALKAGRKVRVSEYHFRGDRQAVRQRAAARALLMLFSELNGSEMPPAW